MKVYPETKLDKSKIVDTIVLSRLVWPEIKTNDFRFLETKRGKDFPKKLIGNHSLEAWGWRTGNHKGDYAAEMKAMGLDPWAEWNPNMQAYCAQDLEVTHEILRRVEAQNYSQRAIDIEHEFAWIIADQEREGVHFNVKGAKELARLLMIRRAELDAKLQEAFPPWEVKTKFVPKRDNKTKGYKKGVPVWKTKVVHFEAGSHDKIAYCLKKKYGWEPTEFTPKGKPSLTEEVIAGLPYPEAKLLSEAMTVSKILGFVAEGKQAWLRVVTPEGKIHGRVITNGAVTGRCTHSKPNLGQVPSARSPYGPECRSLFGPPPGMVQVGVDASGLELRCLAHYMYHWDNGAYARVVVQGKSSDGTDVHTMNQRAADLPTRDAAKTFIYAFLYGAGDVLIGSILVPTGRTEDQRRAGRKIKTKFLNGLPALGKLKETIDGKVKERGYLVGIDGRRLHIRHQHAALNTLLQSAGAIAMKLATIYLHRYASAKGWVLGQDYAQMLHVHDEFQLWARPEIAKELAEMGKQAIADAGRDLGFKCPLEGDAKIGANWKETH